MHRLTLFGRFVEGLRSILCDADGKRFRKSDLVFLITGQQDTSQASRYLRVFDEDRNLFWYHKSTIARMIASAYPDQADEDRLIRRKARGGYEFIGSPTSEVSVRVLEGAIDALWEGSEDGIVLRDAVERAGLTPECPFCAQMYEAYDDEYREGGSSANDEVSDLQRCMLSLDRSQDDKALTKDVYKTLLTAILLGPAAVALLMGTRVVTPRGLGGAFRRVMDGFSLIQMVPSPDGALVPANDLGFERGSEVTIGREAAPGIGYVPLHLAGTPSYVSGVHATVRMAEPGVDGDGSHACELVNLSGTNGTLVRHVSAGTSRFLSVPGDVEPLSPGDEVWLAPAPTPSGHRPSYERGSVLRFEHLYKFVVSPT